MMRLIAGIGSGIIELGPSLGKTTPEPETQQPAAIPSWIKNNAEWWADGQIDDELICSRNSIFN